MCLLSWIQNENYFKVQIKKTKGVKIMKKIVPIRYKMIISILSCIVFLSLAISLILGFQIQSSTLKSYNQFIEQQFFGINKTLFVFESNNQKIVETLSKQRLLKISNSSNVANLYNQNGVQGLD